MMFIGDLWRNTENGPKDEKDCGIYFFRVPKFIMDVSHENN